MSGRSFWPQAVHQSLGRERSRASPERRRRTKAEFDSHHFAFRDARAERQNRSDAQARRRKRHTARE